jgi:hypothetical protein
MTKIFDPKITPGPWYKKDWGVFDSDGFEICDVNFPCDSQTYNENHTTITAIPELLAVLKSAREVIYEGEKQDSYYKVSIPGSVYFDLIYAIDNIDERFGV